MPEGLGPSPEEMGEPETYVKSPELAREMANAEIEPREKLEAAKQLGLNPDMLKTIGIEVDQRSEQRRKEYEAAMEKAEELLVRLLDQKTEILDTDLTIGQYDDKETACLDLLNAIKSRICQFDPETNKWENKKIQLGGQMWEFRMSAGMSLSEERKLKLPPDKEYNIFVSREKVV